MSSGAVAGVVAIPAAAAAPSLALPAAAGAAVTCNIPDAAAGQIAETDEASVCVVEGGLERASATTLDFPCMYRMSVVYSAMPASWYCCLAVCGSLFFEIEGTRLWWSVYSVKALPSNICLK